MVGGLLPAIALLAAAGPVDPGPTVREIVELADMSSIAVSPDGQRLAFRIEHASVAVNDFELGWYIVPTDGSAPPRRIADAGEGERRDGELATEPPVWSADGRSILFRKIANGEIQIWRAAVDGSASEALTHDDANVRRFALEPDSGIIIYSVGATRAAVSEAEGHEYDEGVLIDARVDPARQLHRGARIEGRGASDRFSGRWFTFGHLLAGAPLTYRALDLGTGASRDAAGSEAARITDAPSSSDITNTYPVTAETRSGDRRGNAFVTADDFVSRLSIRRPGGRSIDCERPQCRQRIGKIAWQGTRDGVVFVTTDHAAGQTLRLWSPGSGQVRRIAGGTGRWNGGRDEAGCAVDAAALYCVAADADNPPRLVRIALSTGKITTLADPNRSLRQSGFLRSEPMEWVGASGQRFTGQLMVPSGERRALPLFVTYYLCDGYLRGGVGDEFPLRQLAASGMAVLCINRVPMRAGLGDQVEQYRIGQEGVSEAVRLLARRGIVDPARVGMGGVSFGGETTMWIAQHSSILSAISIGNTLLSPTYYWFNALPGNPMPPILNQVWGIGAPDDDPERWKQLSPTLSTDTIHAPLLMQLPEREFRFNVELAARLAQAGKPVELWAFPEETHLKYQPRHKAAVYERNLDWFRFWLQDYVDPDPTKAEQYRRWRGMKDARSP
ncbi:MAG: Atxe2 family lasso peptide isopeptidase [Sphingopyxis sp.]|nr:Atxe2 family lasso peptide isopeptidase [Sphingopyxis sp.]